MYKERFVSSWKDLKKHPLLFLPDIIIFLMNISLALLFLKYSGLLKLITDPETLTKGLEAAVPTIKLFFKENMLKIIVTFSLFILTSFVIGSGLVAMKLGMMKEVIKRKKLAIRKMINNGKYVWQVISMKMIMFAIGIVTFLFLFGTGIILSTFLHKGVVILIMGLLFPALMVVLQLLLFFRYQIMFLEEKHPIIAVKDSFEYFINNKKHVLIVWLIILAVSFATIPLTALLGITEQKAVNMLSATVIIGYLISNITKIVINVWSEMFKFRSYKLEL